MELKRRGLLGGYHIIGTCLEGIDAIFKVPYVVLATVAVVK